MLIMVETREVPRKTAENQADCYLLTKWANVAYHPTPRHNTVGDFHQNKLAGLLHLIFQY